MPPLHLVMPSGLGTGTPLIQHGRHGEPSFHGVGLVAECGQHFARATPIPGRELVYLTRPIA